MIAAAPVENDAHPEQPWVEHRVLDRELVASPREARDDEREEPRDRRGRCPSELWSFDHREHEPHEATTERRLPIGSSAVRPGSREVGTNSAVSKSNAATIGRVTMNTEPHQKCSSSRPLVIGPSAPPTPANAAQIAIAFGRSSDRERVEDDRERRRHDERRADAHHRAECDQLARVRRRLAATAPAEYDEPDLERALPAEAVADRTRGQQQPGEHERVGVDDPLEVRAGRAEVALDRRQRHVPARSLPSRS